MHTHMHSQVHTHVVCYIHPSHSSDRPRNLDAVLRQKVHGNLVSWNRGILYNECSNVLALVGKQICVLSLNIALLQVLLRIDILTYS